MQKISRAVQFRGKANVLKAYENGKVAPFAIFCGQQLFMKYEDDDIEGGKEFLSAALKQLEIGGGLAVYTLAVYEDLKDGEKIKSNTPFDMSFNFKIVDDYEDAMGRVSGFREYEQRIAGLEEKLKVYEEPEEAGGVWGTINKLMEHPKIGEAIAGKFASFIDGFGKPGVVVNGVVPNYSATTKVAGVPDERHDAEQLEKIRRSVDLLYKVDRQLGDHLLQIAEIALKNFPKYQMFIEMLEKS